MSDFRAKLEAFGRNANRRWIADQGLVQQAIGLLPYIQQIWVKCGKSGLIHIGIQPKPTGMMSTSPGMGFVHALPEELGWLVIRHYPALQLGDEEVVSTTGAGDTLVGGLVAGLLGGTGVGGSGEAEEVWVGRAMERVGRTMRSHRAVG